MLRLALACLGTAPLVPLLVACGLDSSKTDPKVEPGKAEVAAPAPPGANVHEDAKKEKGDSDEPDEPDEPDDGAIASGGPPGELAEADAATVVIEPMNAICGDTYCEGSYDFTFKSLSCKTGDCKLSFVAKRHETGKVFDETVTFTFKGPTLYPVDDVPTDEFMEAIDASIKKWESAGKK